MDARGILQDMGRGGGGGTLDGGTYPGRGLPTLAVGVPTLVEEGGGTVWMGVPTLDRGYPHPG